MGNPRGMIVGSNPEQYKFATALTFEETGSTENIDELTTAEINQIILDATPKVVDELDNPIVLD